MSALLRHLSAGAAVTAMPWRALLLATAPVLLLLSASCTGGAEEPEASVDSSASTTTPTVGLATTSDSGRLSLDPLVAPMKVSGLRWAHSKVPRSVPDVDEPLPSLLDDPPGRALVASYIPRTDGLGWAGEAIEFYGTDGRWRRLSLGDLDLPDDGWSGYDTYGAGALSPNGRWWAGPMFDGMFLVDLRTGETTVRRVESRRTAMASFSWSPDSDELVLVLFGQSTRVAVPSLRTTAFPRPKLYPKLREDGGWVECPEEGRIVSACVSYDSTGTRELIREVPADLRTKWAAPTDEMPGAVFYSLPHGAYGNYRHDWELIRTDAQFAANARLILPRGSQLNGVEDAFDPDTLELAAVQHRLLLAWLVDGGEIVRLLRTGPLMKHSYDFWVVAFARDLVRIR